jgi:hypothetical protein
MLQRFQAELDASGVQILARSTDNLDGPAALATAQGYEFPILFSAPDPSTPGTVRCFQLVRRRTRFGLGFLNRY